MRLFSYLVHPIGWVFRELITRPISYFASSTETRRSVLGYKDPFYYRQPECFSADDTLPDCRSVAPYNYEDNGISTGVIDGELTTSVFLPDVNFDFNKSGLSNLCLLYTSPSPRD